MPDQTLSVVTLGRLRDCWAAHLGINPGALFATRLQVVTHGPDLADYDGLLGFFRNDHVLVSLPPARADELRVRLPPRPITPDEFAIAYRDLATAVIGPAWIGYAETIAPLRGGVRQLSAEDQLLIGSLKSACSAVEWEHGGSSAEAMGLSGVLADGRLVALAGYEVWGGVIAHISVISDPEFRGRDFGRGVVACTAAHALDAGLIPQYQTLESNLPSMRVAVVLGFQRYAIWVAVRLKPTS